MTGFDTADGARALAAARAQSGIGREEPEDFRAALDAFYHFARRNTPTPEGLAQLEAMVQRLLINRLRFAEDVARHPEILTENVADPIVVLGFPRSGTTVLQRMMSADPATQSLKFWRLLNPAPFPGEAPHEPGGRLAFAEAIADAIRIGNPALHAAHPAVADDADEDWNLHHLSFQHVGHIYTGVPDADYLAWLRSLPRRPSYAYVADLLRYLQWQDGGRRERKWILKSPVHVGHLEEMLAFHPGATFVYPRRDFRTVVASFCNALEAAQQPHLTRSPAAIGRIALEYWVPEMHRFQQARARLGSRLKMIEVDYRDMLADPIRHIRTFYEQAGIALSGAGEAAIRAWIADNPAGKHGVNQYSLERYELTEAMVDDAFGFLDATPSQETQAHV